MKMDTTKMHGTVTVDVQTFNKIPKILTISGTTDKIKFLCANIDETVLLKSIGITIDDDCCDWYKVILDC